MNKKPKPVKITRNFEYKDIKCLADIPLLVGCKMQGHTHTETLHWCEIDRWYLGYDEPLGLTSRSVKRVNMDPDYQRGHVWTREQQVAYLEYILRGGVAGQVTYNQMDPHDPECPYECLDGLQRLTAVYKFVHDELPVFNGILCSELARNSGHTRLSRSYYFQVTVLNLPNKADVLRYYLDHNSGGTPHSQDELARVRKLLATESRKAKK